jgi:hypothetical protein
MGLREGDLKDTVLKNISIDEYEPKTGEAKDVMVFGFHVKESAVGNDLYHYISNSIAEVRDVEVSPNPNTDGYYMVFCELDRNEQCLENIRSIVRDVENVSGKLAWSASTHLTEEQFPLFGEELEQYVFQDPSLYTDKQGWDDNNAALEQESLEEETRRLAEFAEPINQFLQHSNLKNIEINEHMVTMFGNNDIATLEVIKYGLASEVMEQVGIAQSAIKPLNSTLRQFNSMLGEMQAVPIDDYIVLFHPLQENILVTKIC